MDRDRHEIVVCGGGETMPTSSQGSTTAFHCMMFRGLEVTHVAFEIAPA
jgi:hypothetical protein